ncbi:hypothetical protein [Hydrogenophaga luteola]|uniref:Uncharacterized protein n=1 Tax=Hydrogenophaga luteola TaxID=1591122 RepID=A0ABV7W7V8_9BURK
MIYQARVLALSDDVEEEVNLQINDVRLNCFAGVCPYPIQEGGTYPVCLELVVFDDYEVAESSGNALPAFSKMGNSFGYLVHGRLNGTCLEAGGLVFEDEVLQRDFGYLDGRCVTMKVDRIDVEFLTR